MVDIHTRYSQIYTKMTTTFGTIH